MRTPYESEVALHLKRNYLVHCADGGLWMGAMAFVAADTIMPSLVRSLGGPTWLIALTPMLMMLGFVWPPILTAHIAESRARLLPFIIGLGVFQRLPFLVAGLALWFFGQSHPGPVLVVVALSPFISGVMGGFNWTAWLEMTSRLIPPRRRASATAIRSLIGALMGFGAGEVVKVVLADAPGPSGYAILHFIAFGILGLSLAAFVFFREPSVPPSDQAPKRSLKENLRSIPELMRSHSSLRRFLYSRLLSNSVFIIMPFLAIHAVQTADRGPAFLGSLIQAQMAGGILGNIAAGWLGDRKGGKIPLVAAYLGTILLSAIAITATGATGFLCVFFLLGASISLKLVGQSTLSLEICPPNRRPTYSSVLSGLSFPTMLLAAGASTLIQEMTGSLTLNGIVTIILMTGALLTVLPIPEPRGSS